ncbi:NAD(P)-dependent oxidoreductase [Longibacter salinarum]|uniref:NAD(P)-dependent oxidoreductase n=1 Tax=Longibacter salinarum TaxID=1850348 RepID=A0A2A8CXE2_9BACT|nr:SDR family oxidoreductase [Longibacter salinarum]PEN13290.1 NAD(P)-dependent oxidoreductase [Longibacter salinarum]
MIAVTGATGHLGRHVVNDLLRRDIAPESIIAAVRSPEKAADLVERGLQVREANYNEPDTLESAFQGVDRLLLISSSEVGQRRQQHQNVVDAAQKNEVDFLAYTSIVRAESNPMLLADEHKATETMIRESGIPFAFLRNGWYIENYTEQLPQYLEHGVILGSAGDGRVSAATRADFAAAAATVLATDEHDNAIYELGGDEAFTMMELAGEISRQADTDVAYQNLPADEYESTLVEHGVPEGFAKVLADADRAISDGHLRVESDDLSRLIGRPTTPLSEAVADALAEMSD